MKKPDTKTIVIGVILLIIIGLLAFFISYFLTDNTANQPTAAQTTAPVSTTEVTTLPPETAPTIPVFTTAPVIQSGVSEPQYTQTAETVYNILDDANIRPLSEPITIDVNEELWFLTLVNNKYRMPADYVVNTAPAIPGSDVELDSRVAAQYTAMYNAAALEDIYLTPYSGYRSYSRQTINYDNKTSYYIGLGYSEAEARAKAAMVIMPPGCSEHNLGLAMDIIATDDNFYTTAAYAWLQAHAADYGFILRYPQDKQSVTEVEYEPWHWRYVGVDYARAINASGMCLEEYLSAAGLLPAAQVSADG